MGRALGPITIKACFHLFQNKATELRHVLDEKLGQPVNGIQTMNMFSLDCIGLVGFGYEFNAVRNGETELYNAWKNMLANNVADGWIDSIVRYLRTCGIRISVSTHFHLGDGMV